MKRLYLVISFLLIILSVWAQGSKRYWDYHLSNIRTLDVVKGNKVVYFLSEGGIFYFNQADNSIETLTKIDGLSGSDFQGIDYSTATNSLVVTYKNAMVDVVSSDGIIHPFPDIKRKNISGNKTIYNATCFEDYCYLACGFGIVVIDLVKLEIKDSFIIGDQGKYQPVYDVAIDTACIYAGTDEGIKFAPRNSPNLLDFANWDYLQNKFIDGYGIQMLETNNNQLWAIHKNLDPTIWRGDKVFSRHTLDTWYPTTLEFGGLVYNISFNSDKTVLSSILGVEIDQNGVGQFLNISEYPFMHDSISLLPMAAIIDNDNTVWIADYNYGAIKYSNGNFEQLTPSGPIDNDAFSLAYSNNKLWVAGGGRDSKWDPLLKSFVIQGFSENRWEYINMSNHPEVKDLSDVVKILPSLSDPDHFYAALWGRGVLEFKDGQLINHYTSANSSLQTISVLPENGIRIGGLCFDSNGNLWMSNSEVESCLSVLRTNGKWQSFTTPDIAFDYKIGDLTVDNFDNIWTIVPRDKTYGLYVMSNDGKQKKHLDVRNYFSNGDQTITPEMNNVFCIKKDNNGALWVGTSNGVIVYNDPENVFTTNPYYGDQPGVIEDNNLYNPLLANQTVTAIAVDGGNRKYCGTKSSGLYLISDDGKYELEHYTSENSNLISDEIISLEYDGDNGILYVGTLLGLVSFHTQSKNSFDSFKNIYAYPNPVRSNYEGSIYISGLMENSNVKITTVSGRLVFETTSVGGQAEWDGNDLAGNRVASGVYLAFCASENGLESAVTKILFIR